MTFTEEWFSLDSCRALASLARSTNTFIGRVIEVGCWEGRSTIALANAVHPDDVQAVDTWEGSPGEPSATLARGRDVHATFTENVAALTKGNVVVHRMGWRDYFATARPSAIRFLHIDAAHTYDEVHDNVLAAKPLLVAGGIICGDDAHHTPVLDAARDALGGDLQYDATLWIWREPRGHA